MASDVVDRDPLLVLDVTGLLRARIRRLVERLAAVAGDPVLPHVVTVGHRDRAVWMQLRLVKEGVEGQHGLVDAALRVKVDVWIGGVGPARWHRLRAGRDAVVTLDLIVVHRSAIQDAVRSQVEHVKRAVFIEEELRAAHQILGSGLDGDPRLRLVGVEWPRAAGAGDRHAGTRRNRITAAGEWRAGDNIGKGHTRIPYGRGRDRTAGHQPNQGRCQSRGNNCTHQHRYASSYQDIRGYLLLRPPGALSCPRPRRLGPSRLPGFDMSGVSSRRRVHYCTSRRRECGSQCTGQDRWERRTCGTSRCFRILRSPESRTPTSGGVGVFSGTMKMNDGDMRTPVWFSDPKISGGFMYDTAIHLLDLVCWLLGPVQEVRCLTRSSCYPDQDDAVMLLRFHSGALVAFTTCGHATWTGPLERLELFGDHAALVTEGFERLTYTPARDQPAVTRDFGAFPVPERLGYAQETRVFTESVARNQAGGPTAEDAFRAVEFVDACYRSAAGDGAPVRLVPYQLDS